MEQPRFKIQKTKLSDFDVFCIIDTKTDKVVCHLNHENGEEYCDEMAEKMVLGLNGAFSVPIDEIDKSKPSYEDLVHALKDTHNLYLEALKKGYMSHDITRLMHNDYIFTNL